jgi:DNA-binding Lrp family transcriptional regulator
VRDELLYRLQDDFPLTARPFRKIAEELGAEESEVLKLLEKLKEEKIIRQTSAIFDTRRLGYSSSLVAFKVSPDTIEKAAEIINTHPGVSHNYERDHDFNLWFTIATAPDSKLGLQKTIERLATLTGAQESIALPTIKMFKISVKLDTTGKRAKKESIGQRREQSMKLNARHYAAIRELQKDIPITSEPFADAIERLNMDYEEYFSIANELKKVGIMRRFATILNHRKAGFTANAMSVWSVPEERAEEIGREMASFSAVSHCYLRPKYPNWPYNLFAMVHAKSQDACDETIEEMAKETGLRDYAKLYSTREFKKRRIVYFDPSFAEWEESYGDWAHP